MTPSIVPTPEGSNPEGDEKTIEPEQVVVGDVAGLMQSFQRMSNSLIKWLYQDEGRAFLPIEGSQDTPYCSASIHREIEKVKFPKFIASTDESSIEACLENMVIFFSLHDYTSNLKVHMVVFQLKGSVLV